MLRPLKVVSLFVLALSASMAGGSKTQVDRRAWMISSPSQLLLKLKPRPRAGADYPSAADYMRILERFPTYGERGWRTSQISGHPIGFFGDPDHAEMGMRSMGNYVFVMALLATDPAYDASVSGMTRDRALARARECLQYMVRGHVTGDLTCADGRPWGDHWQSAWWTAKMALGARLMWSRLTEVERDGVERVVAHEADRHLSRRAPSGSLSDTKSEENAWDTEVLSAAVSMFPAHANARAWRAKLVEFALNSLSAPQDRESGLIVDGRPLSEQVYTANIHADFTIENHGAYHTCYMACPLHSLAWGHYAFAGSSEPAPEALFHHFRDVWLRMRPTFLKDRFAYPAGKDWPRYAYGMSFIMPALVSLQRQYGDSVARAVEARRVAAFEAEQYANADGSFFGRRFTRNIMMDRWAEYETDAYANLAAAYLLHRHIGERIRPPSGRALEAALADAHVSKDAGMAYLRSNGVFASMAWRRLDGPYPSAHFLTADAGDIAEWGVNNLLGRITVADVAPNRTVAEHRDTVSISRLVSEGRLSYADRDGRPLYTHWVRFEADADKRIARAAYRFTADGDITVTSTEGLRLHVANDFHNGYRRVWRQTGKPLIEAYVPLDPWPEKETLTAVPLTSEWVCLDNRLGIRNLRPHESDFHLRVSNRQNGPWGSVHYSVLDCPVLNTSPASYRKGDTILQGDFLVVLGDARRTRRTTGTHRSLPGE